jgi:hypothetical protein
VLKLARPPECRKVKSHVRSVATGQPVVFALSLQCSDWYCKRNRLVGGAMVRPEMLAVEGQYSGMEVSGVRLYPALNGNSAGVGLFSACLNTPN